jgi:hypothetical protein
LLRSLVMLMLLWSRDHTLETTDQCV